MSKWMLVRMRTVNDHTPYKVKQRNWRWRFERGVSRTQGKSDNEGLTLETSASFFLCWKFDPFFLFLDSKFSCFLSSPTGYHISVRKQSFIGLKFNDGCVALRPSIDQGMPKRDYHMHMSWLTRALDCRRNEYESFDLSHTTVYS